MSHYQEVLEQAKSLTPEEQLKLVEDLSSLIRQRITMTPKSKRSILELRLETQSRETVNDTASDPLIGLFAATPDLAINSEDILQNEVTEKSGWTWKEPQQ